MNYDVYSTYESERLKATVNVTIRVSAPTIPEASAAAKKIIDTDILPYVDNWKLSKVNVRSAE